MVPCTVRHLLQVLFPVVDSVLGQITQEYEKRLLNKDHELNSARERAAAAQRDAAAMQVCMCVDATAPWLDGPGHMHHQLLPVSAALSAKRHVAKHAEKTLSPNPNHITLLVPLRSAWSSCRPS